MCLKIPMLRRVVGRVRVEFLGKVPLVVNLVLVDVFDKQLEGLVDRTLDILIG